MTIIRMSSKEFKASGITKGKGGRYVLPHTKEKAKARKNKYNNKSGWWTDGVREPIYMMSQMEANYAHVLNYLVKLGEITDWQYEPDKKEFQNDPHCPIRTYTPDFKVFYPDGHWEYHETKGCLTKTDRTKFKQMRKYYPGEKLRIIFYDELMQMRRNLVHVPGWGLELLKEKPTIKRSA